MKRNLLILFFALSGLIFGEEGRLNIKATVIEPLSIEEDTPMTFDKIVLGKKALSTTSGEDGVMQIYGEKNNSILVTIPSPSVVMKDSTNEDHKFNLSLSLKDTPTNLNTDGEAGVAIIGEILEGATKYTGVYEGSCNISVRYN